ncbi:hypothetical protein V3F56_02600 [Moorellaceae bacterium AZ2]
MKTELCRLWERKRTLWQQYYSLVLEQREVLALGRIEELGRILDRKDETIGELEELEKRWEYLREREARGDGSRAEDFEALEREIRTIVERAGEVEGASLEIAKNLFSQIKNKLNEVQQAKVLFAAYGGAACSVQGAFLDKTR